MHIWPSQAGPRVCVHGHRVNNESISLLASDETPYEHIQGSLWCAVGFSSHEELGLSDNSYQAYRSSLHMNVYLPPPKCTLIVIMFGWRKLEHTSLNGYQISRQTGSSTHVAFFGLCWICQKYVTCINQDRIIIYLSEMCKMQFKSNINIQNNTWTFTLNNGYTEYGLSDVCQALYK